ncbi:MAG: uncharacterized protein JWN04_4517 [Myxococcaceae bacterium]|nr:uncharacterized protein [Myxococcaceae bacterium]
MEESERKELERRIRARALGKARAKLAFRWHLMVFVMVNVALFAINKAYTPNTQWFVWPLAGWGAALAMHAFVTFQGPAIDEEAIEAEVRRELARRTAS